MALHPLNIRTVVNSSRLVYAPEGLHCRLWSYLWSGPTPDRDSALDAEIILHEYTHGMTLRLVSGSPSSGDLQYAGLSEGFSDFYALALLGEPGDNLNGNYAIGAYSAYLWYGPENYYFGLRGYPYSRDMSKDPRTFKDIDPGKANGHPGVPTNPIWEWDLPGSLARAPHWKGAVWCSTLWDARANFIEELGFTTGNSNILQVVTDGIRGLDGNANPTFLEARNCILSADGGVNASKLWAAFYKRGMGGGAQDLSTSETDATVFESFNRADFDLDGKPDIILEDPSTSVKVWTMNGATRMSEPPLSPSSLGGTWAVTGTADINRDGKVDLFLQDDNLNLAYRYLDETSVVSQGALSPSNPAGTWRIVGTGDFNRDAKQDLLWQDAGGYLVAWYMDGPSLVSAAWLSPYHPGDYRWRAVSTGDFNRDGKVDILFQYSGGGGDGQLAVWFMDGITLLSASNLDPAYPSVPEWRVAGTEDYDSDGHVDIVFQLKYSPDGGDLGIWFMNDVNLVNAIVTSPSNPGTGWNAIGPR